jgi:SAM-dependent methyltransferase
VGFGKKSGMRFHAPATERNREPIAAVLEGVLPAEGLVLEIAAGSGEHAVHFAGRFPNLLWQPTDPDPEALASIAAWREEAGLANLLEPQRLDAAAPDWPVAAADAILCVNMVHISPWAATEGLMRGAGALLPPGGPLILYGPYRRAEAPTAPSNEAFDASLRSRNPDWGLRDLAAVKAEAARHGLGFERLHEMPANNLTLVFRRR